MADHRHWRVAAPAAAGDLRSRSLLEALLTPIDSRLASEWSDRLLTTFGTIPNVLAASPAAHDRILGSDSGGARHLAVVRDLMLHATRIAIDGRPIISGQIDLMTYLATAMGGLADEQLRILYLGPDARLLREEVAARGSPAGCVIAPATICRRAVQLGATCLILVHNHPSGNADPSAADIAFTRAVTEVAAVLGVTVADHLIITRDGWSSLQRLGACSQ